MKTKVRVDLRKVENEAHQRAYGVEFPDAVAQLVDLLGVQLVAIMGNVTDGRWVRDWKDKQREPRDPEVNPRLRLALQAAIMLTDNGRSPRVAQAWFQGGNPILDYSAPALVIRKNPAAEAAPKVIEAARLFIGA